MARVGICGHFLNLSTREVWQAQCEQKTTTTTGSNNNNNKQPQQQDQHFTIPMHHPTIIHHFLQFASRLLDHTEDVDKLFGRVP